MYENWLRVADVSEFQGHAVDYAQARDEGGLRGVWARCGFGAGYRDPAYATHAANARAASLDLGPYFFPLLNRDTPQRSAQAIIEQTNNFAGCTLPVMIDVENPNAQTSWIAMYGPQGVADYLVELADAFRALSPYPFGVAYIGGLFGIAADGRLVERYPWNWTANYGTTVDYSTIHNPDFLPGWSPRVAPPWPRLDLFQHSGGNGRCPGFPGAVDLDLVDPTSWAQLTGAHPAPTPIPTTPKESDAMKVHRMLSGAEYVLVSAIAQPEGWAWQWIPNPTIADDLYDAGDIAAGTVQLSIEGSAGDDARFERYAVLNGPDARGPVNSAVAPTS